MLLDHCSPRPCCAQRKRFAFPTQSASSLLVSGKSRNIAQRAKSLMEIALAVISLLLLNPTDAVRDNQANSCRGACSPARMAPIALRAQIFDLQRRIAPKATLYSSQEYNPPKEKTKNIRSQNNKHSTRYRAREAHSRRRSITGRSKG